MRISRLVGLMAAVMLIVAACGDDDAGTTTSVDGSTITTVAPVTTAATTTVAPITAAPTTTVAPTTTQPADAHQVFGLSWADVWPADGTTALYRITAWDASQEDLPAIIEYGVDFRGETFDRLTIGTPEPGNYAMEVYLDRSEPWKVAIKAVATYNVNFPDGPVIVEVFDTPTVFDGSLPIGESVPTETEVILEFADFEERMPATYGLTLVSIGDTVEVPLGTVTGTALMHGSVQGEEFMGSLEPFIAELWLHPQHLIVKMLGSPAFDVIEILETWG